MFTTAVDFETVIRLSPNATEKKKTIALSQGTNLAFFFPENGFMRLLLDTFLLGRSMKRLSLVCGSSMPDPDPLLLTTTSSRPPMISAALEEIQELQPFRDKTLLYPSLALTDHVSALAKACSSFGAPLTGSDVGRAVRFAELSGAELRPEC